MTHELAAVPVASVSAPAILLGILVVLGYGGLVMGALWYAWRDERLQREIVMIVLSWVARWLLSIGLFLIGGGAAASFIGWLVLYGTILVDAAVRRWVPEDVIKELRSLLKRR
jgi:hypothetical protein